MGRPRHARRPHGSLYSDQGRYEEAESLYRRSLEINEKALGQDHPDVAQTLNNLGNLDYSQGRYEEAEPRYRRSLEINEKALGKDHPEVAQTLSNLVSVVLGPVSAALVDTSKPWRVGWSTSHRRKSRGISAFSAHPRTTSVVLRGFRRRGVKITMPQALEGPWKARFPPLRSIHLPGRQPMPEAGVWEGLAAGRVERGGRVPRRR